MEDILREKLNEYAAKYGTDDERTLKVSKQLDPYMTKGQKEYGCD